MVSKPAHRSRGKILSGVAGLVVAALIVTLVTIGDGPTTKLTHGLSTTQKRTGLVRPPLQLAGPWSTDGTYTLSKLAYCEVGDALTIVKNIGHQPAHINSVSARIYGATHPATRVTYEIIKLRHDTTTGELSVNFAFAALGRGRVVAKATGAIFAPVSSSGSWYAVVTLIKVTVNHTFVWGVRGIAISYRVGHARYSTVFPQSVHLPATKGCV